MGGSDTQAVLWGRGAGLGGDGPTRPGLLRLLLCSRVLGRSAFRWGFCSAGRDNSFLVSTVRSSLRNGFAYPVSEEPHSPRWGGWETLIILVLQTRGLGSPRNSELAKAPKTASVRVGTRSPGS